MQDWAVLFGGECTTGIVDSMDGMEQQGEIGDIILD